MAVNLAAKYSSKLDQLFTAGSYTERYVNKKYDFTGAKTVEVYTVTTVAPSNYDRTNTGDRFGGNTILFTPTVYVGHIFDEAYREAWCAVIHGVAKSWTRLSD